MTIQSFRHFMADPQGYLGFHNVIIQSDACFRQTMTVSNRVACTAATLFSEQHALKANPPVWLDMVHTIGFDEDPAETNLGRLRSQLARLPGMSKVLRNFRLCTRANDIGFRWLEFVPFTCTYTTLDAAARFVVTGPLSGCTIAAGRTNTGARVLLHANNNALNGAACRTSQEAMISLVCRTALNVAPANRYLAEYTHEYSGLGFVFGRQLSNGSWRFSAFGSESGVTDFAEF